MPVKHARRTVTLKAYPFTIDIFDGAQKLASHARCYEREQDVFDPLHYLALLEQKPGAFDYAKPLKRWRKDWPVAYHRMLGVLKENWPDGRGIQEFVRISLYCLPINHTASHLVVYVDAHTHKEEKIFVFCSVAYLRTK